MLCGSPSCGGLSLGELHVRSRREALGVLEFDSAEGHRYCARFRGGAGRVHLHERASERE